MLLKTLMIKYVCKIQYYKHNDILLTIPEKLNIKRNIHQ